MGPDEIRKELAEVHKRAFGWALNCCAHDRELAVDVLQNAYYRILSGKASYKGDSNFSTWVFGVIRRVAFEEIRLRQKQRLQLSTLADEVPAFRTVENPLSRGANELAAEVRGALAKLSERQREVLHLTFYQDMTIEQAAHVLEISVGTARQHYARGKVALRRRMAALELEDE